jgi:hypothetical protein
MLLAFSGPLLQSPLRVIAHFFSDALQELPVSFSSFRIVLVRDFR